MSIADTIDAEVDRYNRTVGIGRPAVGIPIDDIFISADRGIAYVDLAKIAQALRRGVTPSAANSA